MKAALARGLPAGVRLTGSAVSTGRGLLVGSGLLVLATAPFFGLSTGAVTALVLVSVASAVLATASLWFPWPDWAPAMSLMFPVAGLAGLAAFGLSARGEGLAYVGVIPLWFVYMGRFHPMRTCALLIPPALAAYVAMVGVAVPNIVLRLVVNGTAWVAICATITAMVSQQKLVTERLQVATYTDSLTALGNRRSMDLRLAEVVTGDCVVVCDLDLFKSINDAFGHAAGDEVLRQFGATINQHLRRRDYAARYGGEEFVLILVHTDVEQAVAALASLRSEWLDLCAGVTFSAGITQVDAGQTADEVLAAADRALFAAKAGGRDCFRIA